MYILWRYYTPSKNSWVRSNTSDFGDHCTTNYTMFFYFYVDLSYIFYKRRIERELNPKQRICNSSSEPSETQFPLSENRRG